MSANLNQSVALTDVKSVLTPEGRLSFPALVKPKAFEGQEPKFQAVLIFPKTADLSALKAAARAAAEERWGSRIPTNIRLPFRDGAEKQVNKDDGTTAFQDGYGPDVLFISATAKTAPQLVDRMTRPVGGDKAEQLFYAGCYVRAYLRAFAYDRQGNRGVSFGLNAVQWVRDGEILGGRLRADQAFTALGDMPTDAGFQAGAAAGEAPPWNDGQAGGATQDINALFG